jgi:hypothetical protein
MVLERLSLSPMSKKYQSSFPVGILRGKHMYECHKTISMHSSSLILFFKAVAKDLT